MLIVTYYINVCFCRVKKIYLVYIFAGLYQILSPLDTAKWLQVSCLLKHSFSTCPFVYLHVFFGMCSYKDLYLPLLYFFYFC